MGECVTCCYLMTSICDVAGASANCQDSLVMTAPGGWLELEEPPVFTKVRTAFSDNFLENFVAHISFNVFLFTGI